MNIGMDGTSKTLAEKPHGEGIHRKIGRRNKPGKVPYSVLPFFRRSCALSAFSARV
jgi:hypothetical protein